MSKSKKQNKAPQHIQANKGTSPTAVAKAASPIHTAEKEREEAITSGLLLPPKAEPDPNTSVYEQAKTDLDQIKQAYKEACDRLDKQKKNNDDEKKAWDVRQLQELQEIEAEKEKVENDKKTWASQKQAEKENQDQETARIRNERQALDSERRQHQQRTAAENQQIAQERRELNEARRTLSERERDIQNREADADAGFLRREEEALQHLQASHQAILSRFTQIREEMARCEREHAESLNREKDAFQEWLTQQRQSWETEKQRQQQQNLQSLANKRSELEEQESQLDQQAAEVAAKLKAAQRKEKENQETETEIHTWIEHKVTERYADIVEKNQRLEERLAKAREEMDTFEEQLREKDDALEKLGVSGPEETKRKLAQLEKDKKRLQKELDQRPSKEEYEAIISQLRTQSECQDALWRKGEELTQLKRRLEGFELEAMTVETLRDQKKALEQNYALLKAELSSLKKEVDGYIQRADDKPIFVAMTAMDQDESLKEKKQLWPFEKKDVEPNSSKYPPLLLKTQVKKMKEHLANDPHEKRPPLYYQDRDLRAFLGGMAMSRLLLLQGISGIGKSSLPRALGTIFGGQCDDLSVQAGWRDKNDLFGYFNSFEKKYYESPLVQALYRAQMPHWEERIIFVLFDEMNLSHPEQYAADILDVLERKEEEKRRFELVSFPIPKGQAPEKLEDGRYLRLPNNVWFVGTANHDETTKDFADKTYDRSFVVELPSQPRPFPQVKTSPEKYPLRCESLVETFERAKQNPTYQGQVKTAKEWLEKEMRSLLADHFGIGWGGRFESQMDSFLPVVIDAGGSLGEGLDQMLSTRLLRKLRGKHDNLQEDIERLKSALEMSWPDEKEKPATSLELLNKELLRLRR